MDAMRRERRCSLDANACFPCHTAPAHLAAFGVGSLGSVIVVSNQSSNAACRMVQGAPRVTRPAS